MILFILRWYLLFFTAITVNISIIYPFMNSNDIAKMIKYYRKQSGLSQKDFAKIAGIGKTALFDIEKGKETVQLDTLLKILDVLNIKMKFDTPFPDNSTSNP